MTVISLGFYSSQSFILYIVIIWIWNSNISRPCGKCGENRFTPICGWDANASPSRAVESHFGACTRLWIESGKLINISPGYPHFPQDFHILDFKETTPHIWGVGFGASPVVIRTNRLIVHR
jgi:hypothetical protein